MAGAMVEQNSDAGADSGNKPTNENEDPNPCPIQYKTVRPRGSVIYGVGLDSFHVQMLQFYQMQHGVMDEFRNLQIHGGGPSTKDANAAVDEDLPVKRRGRCKWFNVVKGWGFITPDDGTQDVFVHQSVIKMTGFRSLKDEEVVEFMCKTSDKGLEATHVSGIDDSDCQGSTRRPVSKKKLRKIRCYNCGEFTNHIAAKCNLEPQPKRCHLCKSESHLIADCPLRLSAEQQNADNGTNNGTVGEKDVNEKQSTK